MVDWDDYRVFLGLSREGSIHRAAPRLRMDLSTVRRRLARLEEALGARLFRRRRQGVVLTAAGERLLVKARAIEERAGEIEREIGASDEKAAGTVRLTAGEAFISRLVAPAMGRFRREHPDVRVELYSDNQRVDLARGDADLAIRLRRPTEDALVGKRVMPLEFGLWASKEYLARAGRPRSEDDLRKHEFIAYDASLERTPETQWLIERGLLLVVRANTPLALYAAAASGAGICPAAKIFAHGLERVLPEVDLPAREVWLVAHREVARLGRVRALHAFVSGLLVGAQ
jgi:DNA-binding transcriptional LysR family regulator